MIILYNKNISMTKEWNFKKVIEKIINRTFDEYYNSYETEYF